jgi:photosystem II protein
MAQAVMAARLASSVGGLRASTLVSSMQKLSSDNMCLQFIKVAPLDQISRNSVRTVQTRAVFGGKKGTVSKQAKKIAEEGLFGTSGGIGFTKANELFVGRMAMIGFAASLLGEALTGKGILGQFDIETGLPLSETEPLLLAFIAFTLFGAIGALGSRGRFVDDVVEPGPIVQPGKGIKGQLGLNEKGPTFGFTKANELFVGRVAQLGFALSIIGELITGKGALAQLNIETGVPITEIEPLVLLNVIFFFIAAINPGNGKFINDDDVEA